MKKILYIDANNLYGYAKSQPVPNDEIKFIGRASVCQKDRDKIVKLEDILKTLDSDIGHFVEADLKYPDEKKTKKFHFLLGIKLVLEINLLHL